MSAAAVSPGAHTTSHAATFSAAQLQPVLVPRVRQRPPNRVRLALCQMRVTADKGINLATAARDIATAAEGGATLVVLPECFNCPYDTSRVRGYAEELPPVGVSGTVRHGSRTLAAIQVAARRAGVTIVAGSIPELTSHDGRLYNTSMVVGPSGELLAKHRKMHLCDVDVPGGVRLRESTTFTPGHQVTTFPMPTGEAVTAPAAPPGTTNGGSASSSSAQARAPIVPLRIGVGICYDVRFPELSALMARQSGAGLLVFPAALNKALGPAHWELLLRARAVDNQVYLAVCSPACGGADDPEEKRYPSWGHSMIVSPWGKVLTSAQFEPEIVYADIDGSLLDSVRTALPISKQRRHDVYMTVAVAPSS
ncbi:hypothetical protein MMPV_007693 [Pyropia vietnamensis]